ncbi:MAG: DUF3108 domain-containing protein [Gemmatimonadetes bacterium]|nr:DUF3108 domain-containing protein [Gemmatimonadota bacterium]
MAFARAVLVAAALVFGGSGTVAAQTAGSGDVVANRGPAPVPFGPGELLLYRVKLGAVTAGNGSMAVLGLDTVRGRQTYRVRLNVDGRVLFFSVHDTLQSWIDTQALHSLRFQQDQKEVRYERHRSIDFFPETMRWVMNDGQEEGPLANSAPLDDVSFVYYVRTLPLEPGQKYTLDRYYRQSGNPVVIEVLKRDEVKVPAGTFQTIVVRPTIQTRGLFSRGGKAEIYFTDDERRLVVKLKSSVPLIGELTLELQSYQPGTPLPTGHTGGTGIPAPEP